MQYKISNSKYVMVIRQQYEGLTHVTMTINGLSSVCQITLINSVIQGAFLFTLSFHTMTFGNVQLQQSV